MDGFAFPRERIAGVGFGYRRQMETLDLPVDPPRSSDAVLAFVRAALSELDPAARAVDLRESDTTEHSEPSDGYAFFTSRHETLYGTPRLGFLAETVYEHDECQGMPRETIVRRTIRGVGLRAGRSLVYAEDLLDGKPGFHLEGEPLELAACLDRFYSDLLRCTVEADEALRALRALYGFTQLSALSPRAPFEPAAIEPAGGGDVAAAVQALDELLRAEPEHPTARWYRAQLYARAGDAVAAEAALARWRAAHPDDSEAVIALAHVRLQRGNAAAALTALDTVPESGRTVQYHATRFEVLYRLERYADALSALAPWSSCSARAWVGPTLGEVEATLLRMRLHHLLGDRAAALRAWQLALTSNAHYARRLLLDDSRAEPSREPRASSPLDPWITRYLEPSWVAELRADPEFEALMRPPSG